jgi:VWFA-related protein
MRLTAFLLTALLASYLPAQERPIRTTVPLVVLPASVTDRHGRFIDGLNGSEFLLLDNGEPRQVRVDAVDSGLAPIALVTAIQTSDISLSALEKIRKIGAMIPEAVVGANGEAAILTFDDHVKVVQQFTTDADAISNVFRDLKPADNRGGRMIDAVEEALKLLANRPGARRANILIIGESRDRGSEEKLSDLLAEIQRTGVTVYSLTYSAYLTPFTTKAGDYTPPDGGGLLTAITETSRLAKRNTAEALTNVTGGRQLKFETKSKLENDLIRLGSEIHCRYFISFTPDLTQTPNFHHLEVRIKDRPDAVIRTRPGYWAGLGGTEK